MAPLPSVFLFHENPSELMRPILSQDGIGRFLLTSANLRTFPIIPRPLMAPLAPLGAPREKIKGHAAGYVNMKNLIYAIRESIGVPEFFFLLGMALLYAGSAEQFNHAVARIVCGAVLVSVSVIVSLRDVK